MLDSPVGSSSPPVPAVAARLRTKKRTINLVNPADPDEFSSDSIMASSSTSSMTRRQREVTPTMIAPVQQETPLTLNTLGVKGILRTVGTPGSGNGVRFYPKNRFRVITPREELGGPSTPQKQPIPAPPPPKSPTSFFSHLLSVVPTMSPRRAVPAASLPEIADESWERPGEEGEISLVASSVASADRSTIAAEDDDNDDGSSLEVPAPWTGPAEVHCSPLFMPMEGSSRDISVQDLAQPEISIDGWKMRLQAQGDVSNLLSTSLPGTSDISFSIGSMAGPSFVPPPLSSPMSDPTASPLPSVQQIGADISSVSWMRADQSSLLSIPEEDDDNPTIRRKISPTASPAPQLPTGTLVTNYHQITVASPLPVRQPKGFTSIFADISAEQAQLSWPADPPKSAASTARPVMARRCSSSSADSVLTPSVTPLPRTTPRTQETGNDTEFFDATSSLTLATPCPTKPSISDIRLTSLRPSSYVGSLGRHTHLSALVHPTQALFEAQQTHTSAVNAELDMYRSLAQKLGKEVEERDRALADLNLRLVESEMRLLSTSSESQSRIAATASSSATRDARRASLSPSLSPSPLATKTAAISRPSPPTSCARAGTDTDIVRDLEIRLEKALADQRGLQNQVQRAQTAEASAKEDNWALKNRMVQLEEAERDRVIAAERHSGGVQLSIDGLQRQLRISEGEADMARSQVTELSDRRRLDQEEISTLKATLGKAREERVSAERLNQALIQAREEVRELQRIGSESERELERERTANDDLEQMIRELKAALQQAQATIAQTTDRYRDETANVTAELNRLRAESASKDLEIMNLQRRKSELKEDREMLNIALDSKQQEVELLKRKVARSNHALAATPLPLGVSQKANMNISDRTPLSLAPKPTLQTPGAGYGLKLHPSTAVAPPGTTRAPGTSTAQSSEVGGKRTSASAVYATPLQANGRTMRSGAVLVGSTVLKDRVMRREGEMKESRSDLGTGNVNGHRRISKKESVLA